MAEKIYLLLAIFGGGMLLFPTLGAFLEVFTFGAAILLPILWLYATVALPAYAVWRMTRRTRLAGVIGIASMIALATLPGQLADGELQRTLDGYLADDMRLDLQQKPTSIQFIVDSGYDGYGLAPWERAPCKVVCQRLLLTGSVQSITVRRDQRLGSPTVVTYRVQQLSSCPEIFTSRTPVLPSTRKAIAENKCITPTNGEAMHDGVSVEEKEIERWSVPRFSLIGIDYVQRLRISKVEAGHETLLVQKTMVRAGKAMTPFWVYVYWGFMTSVKGVAVAQVDEVYNQYRLLDELAKIKGIDVDTRYCGDPRPYDPSPTEILFSQETSDSHCITMLPQAGILKQKELPVS
ncbi:hypothetical protein GR212_16430 [Rhizobium lusitanum]|uniref:Uncharacterized protein n=1 Tax=Rhizobium lusitanum TaxID=293958 RepID=A0A6L9UAM2_9HYPH|nr:hypothetical protein [Rhizobium lusitanum]NEI71167.1 hypothetical protein [Rhizobium lusitanum]